MQALCVADEQAAGQRSTHSSTTTNGTMNVHGVISIVRMVSSVSWACSSVPFSSG